MPGERRGRCKNGGAGVNRVGACEDGFWRGQRDKARQGQRSPGSVAAKAQVAPRRQTDQIHTTRAAHHHGARVLETENAHTTYCNRTRNSEGLRRWVLAVLRGLERLGEVFGSGRAGRLSYVTRFTAPQGKQCVQK